MVGGLTFSLLFGPRAGIWGGILSAVMTLIGLLWRMERYVDKSKHYIHFPFERLGNLYRWCYDKRAPVDAAGRPWTRETIQQAVYAIIAEQLDMKRERIVDSLKFSEMC